MKIIDGLPGMNKADVLTFVNPQLVIANVFSSGYNSRGNSTSFIDKGYCAPEKEELVWLSRSKERLP